MKLLLQAYFLTVNQGKVHQRIAKFCRVLSDIYLQQNDLMTHSSNGQNYMEALYYMYVCIYIYCIVTLYAFIYEYVRKYYSIGPIRACQRGQ